MSQLSAHIVKGMINVPSDDTIKINVYFEIWLKIDENA